jgi:hypothetical protein
VRQLAAAFRQASLLAGQGLLIWTLEREQARAQESGGKPPHSKIDHA